MMLKYESKNRSWKRRECQSRKTDAKTRNRKGDTAGNVGIHTPVNKYNVKMIKIRLPD